MMEPTSAPMGLTRWPAGNPLRIVLCVVMKTLAVSPRAGCVMGTRTALTKKMNKDVVSSVQLSVIILSCVTVESSYVW